MARRWMKKGWWGGALLTAALLPGMGLAEPGEGQGRGVGGAGRGALCEQGQAQLQGLESQARSLAVAEGCTEVSQCKAAEVGAMACGGPRDYLVYCSETTDEDALLRALAQLQRSEEQHNRQCGVASICIFVSEPQVVLVDGMCQEVQSGEAELP
jgi:hypothetical protein